MKYILLLLFCSSLLLTNEIGFDEWFNLQDRKKALKKLIPGTKEYFYYHALYYQHQKQYDKVHEIISKWTEQHEMTSQLEEIKHRQAIFDYDKKPQKALDHIIDELELYFDDQKKQNNTKTKYPSTLDNKLLSNDVLQKKNLYDNNLQNIEQQVWENLINEDLSPDATHALLKNINRPDHERLPILVISDLQYKNSRGFGSLKIHKNLLLKQLDECLTRMPQLIHNSNFIHTYILKLHPNSHKQQNNIARINYISRLWKFVSKLSTAQNSIKAHTLYNFLHASLQEDKYPKDFFIRYIKLPRKVNYINTEFLRNAQQKVNMRANYNQYTKLENIGNDEQLVRQYLQHFLKKADNYEEFSAYIDNEYLKKLFVETKITNGIDANDWYSLLSPEEYKTITERIELNFTKNNPKYFSSKDKVNLEIAIKNVKNLVVKTYFVNTKNYYLKHNKKITTAIDIDGLVANKEQVIHYPQDSQIVHIEKLELDHIKKPGVYIVECIGNGKSSRALIRKGNLVCLQRVGSAGHVFSVYDDNEKLLKTAQIYYGGRVYKADERGEMVIPFTRRPGQQSYIVNSEHFSMLKRFEHLSEKYHLKAKIYIDREQLLNKRSCQIIVQPKLYVHSNSISVSLLEDVVLKIKTTDANGINNIQEVKDFKLHDTSETIYTCKIPNQLTNFSITLQGKIDNLSKGNKDILKSTVRQQVNGIDSTYSTEDIFLRYIGGKYVLQILGKTGEVCKKRIVNIECKHRNYKKTIHFTLQTDEEGRAYLGKLEDISFIEASTLNAKHSWPFSHNNCSYLKAYNIAVGEILSLPIFHKKSNTRDICSLIEMRGGNFIYDKNDHVSLKNGFLEIKNLAAGNYSLWLKRAQKNIAIRVVQGQKKHNYILGKNRYIQYKNKRSLHIANVRRHKDAVRIKLRNHTKNTRVHVVATHFVPKNNIYNTLKTTKTNDIQAQIIDLPQSLYLSGRKIGDEYRYILNRKYGPKYPGNHLRRPSLLLNPWALRDTYNNNHFFHQRQAWDNVESHKKLLVTKMSADYADGKENATLDYSNLNFLKNTSLILANLKTDKKGVISLSISSLQPRQHLHILAVDDNDTVYRQLSLPQMKESYQDLRLTTVLNKKNHYTQRQKTSAVLSGRLFSVSNISTAKVEVYDSLEKVHNLFSTLTKNDNLKEFDFVLRWNRLKTVQKNHLYSKYSCHELNFFIYKKDHKFFTEVIKPYLKNKKNKTFLDQWLLGNSLEKYLSPAIFESLNVFEQILLGQRLNSSNMFQHIEDLNSLRKINTDDLNHKYRTAVTLSSLTNKDKIGFLDAVDKITVRKPLPKSKVFEKSEGDDEWGDESDGGDDDDDISSDFGDEDLDYDDYIEDESAETEENEPTSVQQLVSKKLNFKIGLVQRKKVRAFYRGPVQTEEWVENNYYHVAIEKQANLIKVNNFWHDYARHTKGPFLSTNLIEATNSFSEMIIALAVLDLPFSPQDHQVEYNNEKMTLSPGSNVIVFHQEIEKTSAVNNDSILTRQRFFARDDRYTYINNERTEKFVENEFLIGSVYGCQIIITNPTSAKRKVNALMQIPQGAIPVSDGFETDSRYVELKAYGTKAIEYYFYFPFTGNYHLYPVHISENEKIVAHEKPFLFKVVKQLSKQDTSSWKYISQHGTEDQVINYLRTQNLQRIDLDLIAFRMKELNFFSRALPILQKRQVFNDTLWSYTLFHNNNPKDIADYLATTEYSEYCGMYINASILNINSVEQQEYQHREYWPLINMRINQLGQKRKILNHHFFEQYNAFMSYMRYRPQLTDQDLLTWAIYLLAQDRIDDALTIVNRINNENLETQIQYDYLQAYISFCLEQPQKAKNIARKYESYPIKRWRTMFNNVLSQVKEIENKSNIIENVQDQQKQFADLEEDFEFIVDQKQIHLNYHNLENCEINYYPMDIELLFSRNPFVKSTTGQFSIIRPNITQKISLNKKQKKLVHNLPLKYTEKNVLIEIVAGSKTKSLAYYPHNLKLHISQNYGQLQVRHGSNNDMLSKVYIKVYAKHKDNIVEFYKDGYTDLRGRFDYTSSKNTNHLDSVQMFSILILSDKYGAIVREVKPPKM
ncbi:hypothetical protein [Candidatus Uabimicrobium sp. HlEnr_7]|uniref:hypothetical protein n=1 Tax=Candidatus Uabimicrobium helgolandensis TaxID=3095367 RepID=UPI003556FDF3